MFGDLAGKQEEIKKQLAEIKIEAEAGDGQVLVEANANKEILNIKIDPEKVDLSDLEQLEDLILVAINRAIAKATIEEVAASQKLIQDMLPPGLAGLGNLFGQDDE